MKREEIIGVVCDLYEELKISELGFDLIEVCNKLEINLIPYSSFEDKTLFLKADTDGFNLINPKTNKCEIYYNDDKSNRNRLKFTIPHEIGHIVLGHSFEAGNEAWNQTQEANYFANVFYCPHALMVHYNLLTDSDFVSSFGISEKYACVLLEKFKRRTSSTLSFNEKRLIEIFEKNKTEKLK